VAPRGCGRPLARDARGPQVQVDCKVCRCRRDQRGWARADRPCRRM